MSIILFTPHYLNDMIKFVIYVSKVSVPLSKTALNDLIAESRHNNKENLITGILLHIDGVFLQYIEGPEDKIDQLYQKIKEDDRHRDLNILESGLIQTRKYKEWQMLFKRITLPELNQLIGNKKVDIKNIDINLINHETAKQIFEQFQI